MECEGFVTNFTAAGEAEAFLGDPFLAFCQQKLRFELETQKASSLYDALTPDRRQRNGDAARHGGKQPLTGGMTVLELPGLDGPPLVLTAAHVENRVLDDGE